jgi:predicted AAA+ superfamily ATPase
MVISEFMKHRFNQGKTPLLHFYRDSTNNEVDVLYPSVPKVTPIEIKLGQTIQREWMKGIKSFSKVTDVDARSMVIYGGKDNQVRSDVTFVGYTHLHEVLREMKSFQD